MAGACKVVSSPGTSEVNLWPSEQHAKDYLQRADSIPHRREGELCGQKFKQGRLAFASPSLIAAKARRPCLNFCPHNSAVSWIWVRAADASFVLSNQHDLRLSALLWISH